MKEGQQKREKKHGDQTEEEKGENKEVNYGNGICFSLGFFEISLKRLLDIDRDAHS